MLSRRFKWSVLILLVGLGCKRSTPSTTSVAPASASVSEEPPVPIPSRCDPPREGSVISLGETPVEEEIGGLPFAAEVGQGVSFDLGFAVGMLMPDKNGSKASIVTLEPQGGASKTIPLLTAHGDTPPPRLAPMGKSLLVGILESAASSRRLRIARVDESSVTWGPEWDQARDESLAFDIAVNEGYAAVAWDDELRNSDRSVIELVTFETAHFQKERSPKILSPKGTDAEMPRLVPRPGGFWLTWIARMPEKVNDKDREAGEVPEFRWLMAVPLTFKGAPIGNPMRITPEKGHLLVYDIHALPEGGAVIVYRDDDTPSGSSGGILLQVVLRPDGAGEPTVIADQNLGVGVPTLQGAWLTMADASAETRLSRIGPKGNLLDRLESEPTLGRGELLAARGDDLLVLQPRGRGVRLFVTSCHNQRP